MLRKRSIWLMILYGTLVAGGEIGILVWGSGPGHEFLTPVGALAMLLGIVGLSVFIFRGLSRRESRTSFAKHEEAVRASGRALGKAAAQAMLGETYKGSDNPQTPRVVNLILAAAVGAVTGGSSATGLTTLVGQSNGVIFWSAMVLGIISGAVLGCRYAARNGDPSPDKSTAESPARTK